MDWTECIGRLGEGRPVVKNIAGDDKGELILSIETPFGWISRRGREGEASFTKQEFLIRNGDDMTGSFSLSASGSVLPIGGGQNSDETT